jgi:hypothetical protein
MFRIGDTILSDEIATAKFACDITRCKGACCVVGDSGAPISRNEIPVIRKAFDTLKDEIREEAHEAVAEFGLIQGDDKKGFEITCVNNRECIFVDYTDEDEAVCVIQRAYYQNRFSWEKPISCHLYPVRLKKIAGMEYANFEYIPELCSAGCEKGIDDGIYLSDFLKRAFIRRYGQEWFEEFKSECERLRNGQ